MSKIVFFDIDGTLLDHEKNLPVSVKEALAELRKRGIYTAIATGRAPFMFSSLREELEIDSFVSFNGQYVVFEQEPLFTNPQAPDKLERLHAFAEEKGHPLVFMDDKTMKATTGHHDFINESLGSLNFPPPEKDGNFYLDHKIYQTLLFCEESHDEEYKNRFPDFRFVRWHQYSTDILPAGGSKAEGIKKMVDKLGFSMENVYAFGDGLNDIEMLSSVGTGIAMGNGVEAAKQAADYVTADVDDDGILKGLKAVGLL